MEKITFRQRISFLGYYVEGSYYQLTQHILKFLKYKRKKYGKKIILDTEHGRSELIEAIKKGNPYMAARFGTSECGTLVKYCMQQMRLIKGFGDALYIMCNNAGFFPQSEKLLTKWAQLEAECCSNVDMLGVMNTKCEGWIVDNLLPESAKLMPNSGLASSQYGWTWCLEGKKVLVVHPFAETIEKQYKNRDKLYKHIEGKKYPLPSFQLSTVKAVQTIADQTDERFETWFDALDYMTEEISKIDFDVALIGCGAYGFPLASRIKNMGKIAVHMGGSLQTLFGIKGSRWENDSTLKNIINDYWVYPDASDRPKGAEKVEGGCYW